MGGGTPSHHHHHLSLNREGRWGTTDDFTTSFLYFPCCPLPFGTWLTPGLSISRSCLPTSPSVCIVFFSLSLCLARWFWSDQMNARHDHTLQFVSLYDSQEVFVWSPIACWTLARTSSLVTWLLYEMRSILR